MLTRSGGSRHTTMQFFYTKLVYPKQRYCDFFRFFKWPLPPSWIFEIMKFYQLTGSRWSRHISMPNIVSICQSFAKILRFFNFLRWHRPPSCIRLGHIWTPHSEYLWVSITLQNSVMIDAVVFIRWTFRYLTRSAEKCLFTPKKMFFLGNLIP